MINIRLYRVYVRLTIKSLYIVKFIVYNIIRSNEISIIAAL